MNAKLKAKWLRALRGKLRGKKYRQTQTALKNRGAFCCLGVLADIQGAKWIRGAPIINGDDCPLQGCVILLPRFAGGLRKSTQAHLALMNDGGDNFKKIADFIERRVR